VTSERIAVISERAGIRRGKTRFRVGTGIAVNGKRTIQLLALVLLVSGVLIFASEMVAASSVNVQQQKGPIARTDAKRLEGRWVRPDGGYVLELSNIQKDGGLKAAYFNPQPIKVYQSKWKNKKGILTVYVELRDINYPGSKYELRYDPASDRLNGTYFQAVDKETYAIEFVRIK